MEGKKAAIAINPEPFESRADIGGTLDLCDETLAAMKERSDSEFEAERLAKFGEEVLVVKTDKVLLSAEDYASEFGLDFEGCKVFQNTIDEGIFVKNPIGRGRYQMYEAILEEEGIGEALYVFHPVLVDYRPFLEDWKRRNGWKTIPPGQLDDARREAAKDARAERIFASLERITKSGYPIAILVCPALIAAGVLLGVAELLFMSALLAAYSAGVLLGGSSDGGSRARGIVGIAATIEFGAALIVGALAMCGLI